MINLTIDQSILIKIIMFFIGIILKVDFKKSRVSPRRLVLLQWN